MQKLDLFDDAAGRNLRGPFQTVVDGAPGGEVAKIV